MQLRMMGNHWCIKEQAKIYPRTMTLHLTSSANKAPPPRTRRDHKTSCDSSTIRQKLQNGTVAIAKYQDGCWMFTVAFTSSLRKYPNRALAYRSYLRSKAAARFGYISTERCLKILTDPS